MKHIDQSRPRKREILARNRLEYDAATDPYWRLTVYDAVHDGRMFSNIGGRQVLDFVGRYGRVGRDSRVLELCSGLGDTCSYLASSFECRVTGVEMNASQIEQARALASHMGHGPLVRFLHADVLEWTPNSRFDVAYAVDSMMLIEDIRRLLKSARQALGRSGRLVVADVLAGPGIDQAVRRFVWEEDGIICLPDRAEQESLLRACGFEAAEFHDLTALARECFEKVAAASRVHAATLIAAKGEQRYRRWVANALRYRDFFRERALTYGVLGARAV